MNYRFFNKTDSRISEIGLGTWQLGSEWGQMDDETAAEVLATALQEGITFFDTADVYGLGKSETRIGRCLQQQQQRDRVFVATKLGRFPEPGWPENFTLRTMRKHTEASLRRLGRDVIDLTQLHCIDPEELRRGEVFENLRTLQAEGKIRHFGASVETMEEALLCLKVEGLASLQIIFNIFRQKPIDVLFDRAKEKGVAIIVRLPVASGLLCGKFTKSSTFSPDDHRNFNRDGARFNIGETFAGLPFAKGVTLADELRNFVPEGMSMTQMALRWILDYDAVSAVIPGAKNPAQVGENASASDLAPLSDDLHKELSAFYREKVFAHIRGPY